MNPHPDYSAAYVILKTDRAGLEGHGLTFTIGRGNEICCAAIEALRHLVVGLDMDPSDDMGALLAARHLRQPAALDRPGQGRHAPGDRRGRQRRLGSVGQERGQALWRLVADMTPEELVRCIDFRYLTDCITPERRSPCCASRSAGKAERIATLEREGYPCYTTSAGWLGYDDDEAARGSAARPSTRASTTSSSRSAATVQDDIRRLRHRPRSAGPGAPADDRRQPGLGGRPGDRLDGRPRLRKALVHRGADQPRRH